jgi:SAM-dependent methyltransferase
MSRIPDLTDPRYLHEVGWFLYHEKYLRHQGGSFDEERLTYSRTMLEDVLHFCGQDRDWLAAQTVVSIGCGCTGDLATWPAAVKVAADPLALTYQKLGMLLPDAPGTNPTLYLSAAAEDLPLLDDFADLVVCRNALDHMPQPRASLAQMVRVLKPDGRLFLSVDIGGHPTPDEPTVFTRESLSALLEEGFALVRQTDNHAPHSQHRTCSLRILARKRPPPPPALDREAVLRAYVGLLRQDGWTGYCPWERGSADWGGQG